MNRDFVTASAARQSMQPEGLDCFTAFAMTTKKSQLSPSCVAAKKENI
jgi:hypothetical protein